MSTQKFAKIISTGSYVPEKVLTNTDLSKLVDTTDEWITTRTGIKERRIATDEQSTSDLATQAAKKALDSANLDAAELDLIIVATITPNTFTPSTACYVQTNLGAKNAVAFDISAACSGFIFAMDMARNFIENGTYEHVLIIGAEKLSTFVNWEDRNTCVLFGDGAGAAVISATEDSSSRILSSHVGSDGTYTDLLKIEGGGSACPITTSNVDDKLNTLSMQGKEIFKLAVHHMKNAANQVIEDASLTPADIDWVIPHQANLRIIDAISSRLDIDAEKVFVNLDKYGNTSAAAVAIALDEAHRKGVQREQHVVLVAFGAGLTWGAAAIRW